MKAVTRSSRHFSTVKRQLLVSSIRKPEVASQNPILAEEFLEKTLDQYPDIKTLKKLQYSRIFVDRHLRRNPSLGIKLMRAYAACGEIRIARHIFDGFLGKNVIFFNVMIRSYANNHIYCDALRIYKTMSGNGFGPDNYTFPSVLKACSGLDNMWVGLQIHGAVVKVELDMNLYIGSRLVAMYGKCGRLEFVMLTI